MTAPHLDLNVLTGGTGSWANAPMEFSNSGPSSVYSGSPAHSELSLPVIAPRPQHAPAGVTFDMWHDNISSACQAPEGKEAPGHVRVLPVALTTQEHLGVPAVAVAGVDVCVGADAQMHVPGFEMLFDGTFTGVNEF